MTCQLEAEGLCCVRGVRQLFVDVSFSIANGQWLHVSGDNGRGKSSLLRILAGLSRPEAGVIKWNGEHIDESENFASSRFFLSHLTAVKDELTARENLSYSCALESGGFPPQKKINDALAKVGLTHCAALHARYHSEGQKRRIILARLCLTQAKLWVLDEPFTALDRDGVQLLSGMLEKHLSRGGLAVLTSHQSIPMRGGLVMKL